LRPLKRKQISAIVAERLGLSAETVDEIASCYFKIVQKKLTNLEEYRLTVDKLGTFTIKRKKLEDKRRFYQIALDRLEEIENPDMKDYKGILKLKKDIEEFDQLLEKFDGLDEKFKLKEEEKINYKNKKS
jgi:nucleoid DNA-binding protein